MTFRCKNRSLCNYGHIYKVKIEKKYYNGYEVDWNGKKMSVPKSDIEILEISEEEKNIPVCMD